MSSKKGDDLTDITQLPDLDIEEDDKSFSSLDELASDMNLSPEETPPEFSQSPDFTESDDDNDFSDNDNFETQENDFSATAEDKDTIDNEDATNEFSDFESNQVESEDIDFSSDDESEELGEFDDTDSEDTTQFEPLGTEDDFEISQEHNGGNDSDLDAEPELSSSFISEDELVPRQAIPETKIQKTLIQDTHKETHTSIPEQFEEFKNFAKSMTYTNFDAEGNPPFSIILKNLRYVEDVEEITRILIELSIISKDAVESTVQMLSRGQLLIPRLSEYAAIYLCHKLRMYDLEILMGLTEEINPPKSYQSNDRGPSSKRTLLANKKHHFQFDGKSEINEVLTSTLSQIQDYKIVEYLGVITESTELDQKMMKATKIEESLIGQLDENTRAEIASKNLAHQNLQAGKSQNTFDYQAIYHTDSDTSSSITIDHVYQDLVAKCKQSAKSQGANAVLGINFSITPISTEDYLENGIKYQVLCSGNLAWIEKI